MEINASVPPSTVSISKNNTLKKRIYKYRYFYLMLLPVMILLILFSYVPMIGIRYAFYNFTPWAKTFCGFDNFKELFTDSQFWGAFKNTLFLSLINLFLGTFLSVAFALLMNELINKKFKSVVQTILYMPYFISWVVVASIFTLVLSPQFGVVNTIIGYLGIKPIYFLAIDRWWTGFYIFISRWRDTGWGTVIYLAALSGINTDLYEAASIDGANRWSQTWHVTLPGIANTILVVVVLNLAKIMNLFESVFVLQNTAVIGVSEVIQTYTYKIGLQSHNYGYATAVGLFNSLIGMALVIFAQNVNKKVKGEGII